MSQEEVDVCHQEVFQKDVITVVHLNIENNFCFYLKAHSREVMQKRGGTTCNKSPRLAIKLGTCFMKYMKLYHTLLKCGTVSYVS